MTSWTVRPQADGRMVQGRPRRGSGVPLYLNELRQSRHSRRPRALQELLLAAASSQKKRARRSAVSACKATSAAHRTPRRTCSRTLDSYANLNLRSALPSSDVDTDDEELQADYTRDFLSCATAFPQSSGLASIGASGPVGQLASLGAMFRQDWSEKPRPRPTKPSS